MAQASSLLCGLVRTRLSLSEPGGLEGPRPKNGIMPFKFLSMTLATENPPGNGVRLEGDLGAVGADGGGRREAVQALLGGCLCPAPPGPAKPLPLERLPC